MLTVRYYIVRFALQYILHLYFYIRCTFIHGRYGLYMMPRKVACHTEPHFVWESIISDPNYKVNLK